MSELATLVARRLCHDLAGPAGAIATVVEMLGDGPADAELQSLLVDSTATLLTTLRLHRFVLGGGDSSDYRTCFREWLATRENIDLDWAGDHQLQPAAAALLLGLAMIAAEAAPGAAKLVVGEDAVTITAARLSFDPQIATTLGGAPATTPKGALAALLIQAAAGQHRRIMIEATLTRLRLALV